MFEFEGIALLVAYSVVEYIFRERLNLILRTLLLMVIMFGEFFVCGIWPGHYMAIPISGVAYLLISFIVNKFKDKQGKEFEIFMMKQSIQVFVILVPFIFGVVSFPVSTGTRWNMFLTERINVVSILLVVIVNIWLAPRIIRSVLNDLTYRTCQASGGGEVEEHLEDDGAYHAGTLIGILERLLIITALILSGNNGFNISFIGFILGTKSLARFKKFDNQEFVEYFIVGTMASVLFALLSFLPLKLIGKL